jgi:glycerol-3-phosphate acyltransferase PlsY
MIFWMASLAGLVIAYLLGATPTGYLAGRLVKGVDLRQVGSGSTGATNVLRTLGPGPAAAVLAIDLAKGAAAIVLVRGFEAWLYTLPSIAAPATPGPQALVPWAICLAGLAVVLGHSRSIWLGFAGGKSAATGLGVLFALSWPVGLGAAAVFLAAVALFRIVSLGSMLGALTAIGLILVLPQPLPYRLLVLAGGAFVIARHRANIGRLIAGTEPRLGQASTQPP